MTKSISLPTITQILSQVALARHVGIPLQRINEIVRGKRHVTPHTSRRFAQAFGVTPEFWINPQAHHHPASSRPVKPVERLHHVAR